MGIELEHPLVASASPLSSTVDGIRQLEDAGAAAVVMFSLFEEQVAHENAAFEHLMDSGSDSFAESLSYFPDAGEFTMGPARYLQILRRASEAVDIPVIASLNGITNEGWIDYARQMQDAGARGLELNVYYIPADLSRTGGEVETHYIDVAREVKEAVTIPVAIKLSPFFSSTGNMAKNLDDLGVDALVLFNRFYQPDFDIERLEVAPTLSLSTPEEIRLPLLWIAILHGRVRCSLAATRGVHGADEVVKYLLAGADAVMTASALLKNGIGYLETLREGLQGWLERHGFDSVEAMKGVMSHRSIADPTAFERANYLRILERYKSAGMS
jgi:dihydroorotate dehydrogenase (fumarate)